MNNGLILKGFEPAGIDLEKINQFACRELTADEIYVFKADLCNNDIDRDFECFSVDALNTLAKLFVGKTGIKNHMPSTENQLARIYDAEVIRLEDRKTQLGEDFYTLRAKAYMIRTSENESIIKEIDAGIKKEISISCSAGKSTCSVCGNDKRKNRCAHTNGKSYEGKLCYSVLDDITDAYEFSFVAVPAQKEAGVIKSFLHKGDVNLDSIIKQLDFKGDSIVLSKEEAGAISSYLNEMEENARLGNEYRKSLVSDLVRLCPRVIPNMDLKTFEGVASIMTAKELVAFKNAFEGCINEKSKPVPQLAKSGSKHNYNNNEFKI